MKITAILCTRNDLSYLKYTLPYLDSEEIEVALIDNGSDDGTLDTVQGGAFSNVIHVETFPFTGKFDLSRQLEIKSTVARSLRSDWIIHQDADEILHSPTGWGGLRRHIETADSLGFNVLNFDELVMLPSDPTRDDILHNNCNYYFFEPRPLRLMRVWKQTANLDNSTSGGHILFGEDVNVYPQRMILKHFIVRSQEHAYSKYLYREFSSTDISKGWHGNRRNFTMDNLRIPTHGQHLHSLKCPLDVPEGIPPSIDKHFWEWLR